MVIKEYYKGNIRIQICVYCKRVINGKHEKKRGTCMLCDNKYNKKIKLGDFIK